MTMFTVPIGNNEIPEAYRHMSIDLAELMQAVMLQDPKAYICELLLSMKNIENINIHFEDWERVVFKDKLTFIINSL
jgi:hypothetical protein